MKCHCCWIIFQKTIRHSFEESHTSIRCLCLVYSYGASGAECKGPSAIVEFTNRLSVLNAMYFHEQVHAEHM